MQVTGQVFKVYEKTFSGKNNYSVKLENDPLYYRMNQKRFAGIAEPGNTVTFSAEMNEDGKSARVTGELKKASGPAAAAAPVSTGNRESSIHYQSARKDALVMVDLLIRTEALSLGKAPAKKAAIIEAALDRYTALFFEDIGTMGAVTRCNGEDSEGASEEDGDSEADEE